MKKSAAPDWFSSDFRLIHQAEIRGNSRTLRRSHYHGETVGKPRLLPKCCNTHASLPRGNRLGSHGAGTPTRSRRVNLPRGNR
jgi:hypothetical protein